MAETVTIAEMANKVSTELFSWFKWECFELTDQNFNCIKKEKHAPRKAGEHTHPVDVVFFYRDPYSHKNVYLNTDLKSYAVGSIQAGKIRSALKSLACAIDCASVSPEWKAKYSIIEPAEIRGMLFVYNHDNSFDKNFYNLLKADTDSKSGAKASRGVKVETIKIKKGQQLHIVDPSLINYMTTILADVKDLHHQGTFPHKNYYFYYPEQTLHKPSGDKRNRPATLEMIAAPYMVIEHDDIMKLNETSEEKEKTFDKGIVVYYNKEGNTSTEFLYLLDMLSKFQLLEREGPLRIRVAHASPHSAIRSHFKSAITEYAHVWGFDQHKTAQLNKIHFDVVVTRQKSFTQEQLGWRTK